MVEDEKVISGREGDDRLSLFDNKKNYSFVEPVGRGEVYFVHVSDIKLPL